MHSDPSYISMLGFDFLKKFPRYILFYKQSILSLHSWAKHSSAKEKERGFSFSPKWLDREPANPILLFSVKGGGGLFPWGWSGRGVKLTVHFLTSIRPCVTINQHVNSMRRNDLSPYPRTTHTESMQINSGTGLLNSPKWLSNLQISKQVIPLLQWYKASEAEVTYCTTSSSIKKDAIVISHRRAMVFKL
jgi:hypothetical protein